MKSPMAAPLMAGFTLLASLTVLIGWATDSDLLKSLDPRLTAMNPLTAVSFIMLSLSLIFLRLKKHNHSLVFAMFVMGGVSIKLLSFMGFDLELDRLLFSELLIFNRMAPNTAFCFFMLSWGFFFHNHDMQGRTQPSYWCALFSFLGGTCAILGYALGIKAMYTVGDNISMALNTAILFVLLTIGLVLTEPAASPEEEA